MTLEELVELMHERGDVLVSLTTINVPDTSRGSLYGIVEWGRKQNKRTFRDEQELRTILERIK